MGYTTFCYFSSSLLIFLCNKIIMYKKPTSPYIKYGQPHYNFFSKNQSILLLKNLWYDLLRSMKKCNKRTKNKKCHKKMKF